jgi:ABC-type bacteriocin/lantibiotic exporter with double-glycine peptidase domain
LADHPGLSAQGLIAGVFRYVFRHTGRDQLLIVAIALLAMPILYATLELPKRIINDAIDAEQFPIDVFGVALSQVDYLFLLCSLFLLMLSLNCGMKYWINVYKGRVAESLICRMRLQLYRCWRSDASRGDGPALIPVVVQEVEPVDGFAGQALAVPLLEGGTFLTILLFMMIQDPILGSAAILLLPVQLAIVPRLQRRINRLARRRAKEVRALGGLIVQPGHSSDCEEQPIINALQRIKKIRFDIHRRKFFMKSLNNFISHLTPFFFYAIGGYLVIQERLTFGALVAVIAAHKDFTPPLKELFGYYQITEDVRVRYEEIRRFLAPPVEGRLAGHAKSGRLAPISVAHVPAVDRLAG